VSVKSIIAKFEQERVEIQAKIDALTERDAILVLMLKELSAAGAAGAPPKKAAAKQTRKPRAGKKSGAMTVRDAIMNAVNAAKDAIPANEIIAEAVRLSGGAVASIRTQINSLTRGGELSQEPYEGRGFKYKAVDDDAPKTEAKPKPKAKAKAKPKKAK